MKSFIYRHKNKVVEVILYHSGEPWKVEFLMNGTTHRYHTKGPAIQTWHKNGQPSVVSYWRYGERHRPVEEGPAHQSWFQDGQPGGDDSYWEYGKVVEQP